MPLVDARDYSFRYLRGKEPALKNITLSIEPGTVLGVVGKAGAGKSTLLKALMGIVPHIEPGYMEGELTVAGKSIRDNDVSEMAHHVSIVLETPEVQIFSLTVKDDIAFGPANLGLPRQEIWERVQYAIVESELQGFEDRNPNNLSGGEQQSLALAGALAMRPKLLAMDEPVSMLDPLGKERVMGIMERVTRTGGATTIISESGADIEAIAEKVDRVVALHEGRILVDGGPETLADVRMEQIGVGRPQVAELFDALRQAGVKVETIPTTLPAAEEGVRRLLGDRKIKTVRLQGDYRNGRSKRTFGDVIVDVSDLRHTYPPDVRALRGVSLQIRSGEIVGVIGQNGSGKTTMARHLVGLLKPTSKTSRVTVLGADVTRLKMRDIIRKINYVFQNADDQIFANTIREEVAFAPEMMELPKEEADALVKEALETFHLDGHEDDYTLSLPEDLKTYLSIASIYPLKPQILLIDEPTTGLDTHGERTMMDSLCRLRDAGHTLVIITHNMKTVARYCDRAIVMSQGEIVMDAPVREVYGQPERLLQADIRPPQITRLGQDLKDLGLPQDVLTVDEMARVLTHNLLNEG
jgi:energy-coupling factor transporter ATP-binding protein EcfA2